MRATRISSGVKVLHLGKFDGDVGGIERYLRALLGGLPPDIEALNLVANDRPVTDEHNQYRYRTVRAACYGSDSCQVGMRRRAA